MGMRSIWSSVPTVKSGLLGKYEYDPRRRGAFRQAGARGNRGFMGYESPFGEDLQAQVGDLAKKYMEDIPGMQADTGKLYEEMAGGMRQDMGTAMTQAGQIAISQAATAGRDVADTMARYLPEAVKGLGSAAAGIAGQATGLATKRAAMASGLAQWDVGARQREQEFLTGLKQQYSLAVQQMNNNLQVAQIQARSAAERQAIANAHAMRMQQMRNDFAAKAQQYGEAQRNARQAYQLRMWQSISGRGQTISGVNAAIAGQSPFNVMDASGAADNPTLQGANVTAGPPSGEVSGVTSVPGQTGVQGGGVSPSTEAGGYLSGAVGSMGAAPDSWLGQMLSKRYQGNPMTRFGMANTRKPFWWTRMGGY